MGRYREKTSTFFTGLAYRLGKKHRPAIIPLSISLGSPAPQTSLIFQLPDELILSILSYISPDPRFTGHYARFRVQYGMEINDHHQQRVGFLLPLSMTCKVMRLRLLPWVWERLDVSRDHRVPWRRYGRNLDAAVNALHADVSLAINVKFTTMYLASYKFVFPLFIRCLKSLPNLHTLEIAWEDVSVTILLRDALKHVKLPQIKTLILPPPAHPLLKHCPNVEDVVCAIRHTSISSGEFLGSLASNLDSKVRRLAIPLFLWSGPPRYVAACPRLTELTILYPHSYDDTTATQTGVLLNTDRRARSATLELVNACKALPDFNTLQIVYFIRDTLPQPFPEQQKQALRDQVKGVKDLAIDCLKKLETGCLDGEGGKKTTLRVIELSSSRTNFQLDSVEVEEYVV